MSFKSYEVSAPAFEELRPGQAGDQALSPLDADPGRVLVYPGHSIQYVEPGKGTATIFPDGTIVSVIEGADGVPVVNVSLGS
jgi:hypothetical protein